MTYRSSSEAATPEIGSFSPAASGMRPVIAIFACSAAVFLFGCGSAQRDSSSSTATVSSKPRIIPASLRKSYEPPAGWQTQAIHQVYDIRSCLHERGFPPPPRTFSWRGGSLPGPGGRPGDCAVPRGGAWPLFESFGLATDYAGYAIGVAPTGALAREGALDAFDGLQAAVTPSGRCEVTSSFPRSVPPVPGRNAWRNVAASTAARLGFWQPIRADEPGPRATAFPCGAPSRSSSKAIGLRSESRRRGAEQPDCFR